MLAHTLFPMHLGRLTLMIGIQLVDFYLITSGIEGTILDINIRASCNIQYWISQVIDNYLEVDAFNFYS